MQHGLFKLFCLAMVLPLVVRCEKVSNPISKEEKLLALAKTYGYIKYFHPSDEAADLNWDLFGVVASKKVSSEEDLNTSLT